MEEQQDVVFREELHNESCSYWVIIKEQATGRSH
jgi:hypothetical protein